MNKLKQNEYYLWVKQHIERDTGKHILNHYVNTHKVNYLLFERYRRVLHNSGYKLTIVENESRVNLKYKTETKIISQTYNKE